METQNIPYIILYQVVCKNFNINQKQNPIFTKYYVLIIMYYVYNLIA